MKITPEPHRTFTQLVTITGQKCAQSGLRFTLPQGQNVIFEASNAERIGEENGFGEFAHE
jgi:hypothetical protein